MYYVLNDNIVLSPFRKYINQIIKKYKLENLINLFYRRYDKVYLFSGIIRNFFLGYKDDIKDIDLVVYDRYTTNYKPSEDRDTEKLIYLYYDELRDKSKYIVDLKYNDEVGDYSDIKISCNGIDIDVWTLRNSYGYISKNIDFIKRNPYNLIDTAFFNCSSIVYDLKSNKFIYNENFEKFIISKKLSIINTANVSDTLQVHKMIKYCNNYNLAIDEDCKRFVLSKLFSKNDYHKELEVKRSDLNNFLKENFKNKIEFEKNNFCGIYII